MSQPDDPDSPEVRGFWVWLIRSDSEGSFGLSNIVNRWTLLFSVFSVFFAYFGTISAFDLARNVALPATGGLIGLSFAWAGRSSSLLQDKEFSNFIIDHGPPIEGYIYSFQLAILSVIVFVSICAVLLAGGIGYSLGNFSIDESVNRLAICLSGLIALRECWGVIYFSNKLTIQFYLLKMKQSEHV